MADKPIQPMTVEQVLEFLDNLITYSQLTDLGVFITDFRQARTAVAGIVAERDRLRGFAKALFEDIDWPDGADLDGMDFQELATKHDLLEEKEMEAPCGENCQCRDMGEEPPFTCFRKTPLLTGTEE